MRPLLPELDRFARYNHSIVHIMLRYSNILLDQRVVRMLKFFHLHRLLAVGLEVPEETFVRQHGFDADGETYRKSSCILENGNLVNVNHTLVRFMK